MEMLTEETERAFVLLRPEAVGRGVVGTILGRLERLPARLIAVKQLRATEAQIRCLYDRPDIGAHINGIVAAHATGPVVAAVFLGPRGLSARIEEEVEKIRLQYACCRLHNFVHASDNPVSAERETGIFFDLGEITPEGALSQPGTACAAANRLRSGPLRVAVEGISCAGKTSLIGSMASSSQVLVIPESTSFTVVFPPPPGSPHQARTNENFCLAVERLRLAYERACSRGTEVILYDRSYLSVLAIAWSYAPACGADAFRALVSDVTAALHEGALVPPDLFLHLDLPLDCFTERNESRQDSLDGFWASSAALARQKEFFAHWFDGSTSIPVCRLDARLSRTQLLRAAQDELQREVVGRPDLSRHVDELCSRCLNLLEESGRRLAEAESL